MIRVLVLGGSYLQSSFIKQALSQSDSVYVVDANKFCYAAVHGLGHFNHLDFSNLEAVLSFCRINGVSAIFAPVNELGNLIAAKASEVLGLYYNPVEVVETTSNKKLLSKALFGTNLKSTKTFYASKLDEIEFPIIVKPLASSSSKGVSLVRTTDTLEDALNYAKKYDPQGEIRLEEFIDGPQYSLETISFNKKHYLLAVIEEHLSSEPYFFERSDIYDNDKAEEYTTFFEPYVVELLDLLKVDCGPCHIEVRVKNNYVYLIDFATRSGGWRDIMLAHAGLNYNELILASQLRTFRADSLNNLSLDSTVGAGILLYHEDILKLKEAAQSQLMVGCFFNGELPKLAPHTLADSYGYYFVKSKTRDQLNNLMTIEI